MHPNAESGLRSTIIAEAGINHDGDLETASRMVDVAAAAGADYVKFQSFRAESLVTPNALMSSYIEKGSHEGESFEDVLRRLELGRSSMAELKARCDERGVKFLSTAFDEESFRSLIDLGIDVVKVASGDLTSLPFLRTMAGAGLPMILSTGMATLGEIEEAIEAVAGREGNDRLTLMHCISWYPAEFETVNLRYMKTLRSAFGFPVGYSDHTLGISMPLAARALGAVCLEKHFTLDSTRFGPDHAASIEPAALGDMIRGVREVEAGLGSTCRAFDDRELHQRRVHRRSLVVARPIGAGECFTREHLMLKRPGTGLAPKHLEDLIGRRAARSLEVDTVLEWSDVASAQETLTAVGQKRVRVP